jgi:hypothetical protein
MRRSQQLQTLHYGMMDEARFGELKEVFLVRKEEGG